MDVIRDVESREPPDRPTVVTVGNFDGVHRGHQALVRRVIERARAIDGLAVAMTFDPHPQALLHPASAPLPLSSMAERIELLAGLGLDALVILHFTPELAKVEAETFVARYLRDLLRVREVYVGSNFGFGRGKRGDVALLERLAPSHGYVAGVVDLVTDEGTLISSTRIRDLLARGELRAAEVELSRRYQMFGTVAAGDGRGRTLGFPTANVEGDKPCVLPHGVYAVTARVLGAHYGGALNFGLRPTFDKKAPSMEVHLLDYAGPELAGQPIRISFVERLREERRFASVAELRQQIAADVAAARQLLGALAG